MKERILVPNTSLSLQKILADDSHIIKAKICTSRAGIEQTNFSKVPKRNSKDSSCHKRRTEFSIMIILERIMRQSDNFSYVKFAIFTALKHMHNCNG
jgi:hypothetical protein